MNGALHYGQTRRWAIEAGFDDSEADEIARADIGVDRLYPGRIPVNWPWHYRIAGADRRATELLAEAVDKRDLALLGMALHCRQDALTHNFLGPLGHWPGIDSWETRREAVRRRIEFASREMLAAYQDDVALRVQGTREDIPAPVG